MMPQRDEEKTTETSEQAPLDDSPRPVARGATGEGQHTLALLVLVVGWRPRCSRSAASAPGTATAT